MSAGKVLGGSGSHNNLHWERGSPYDYQRWANLTGDDSWLYENVLPYFKRIENYKGQFSNATGEGLSDCPKNLCLLEKLWKSS